ncbi:tetratricopeptide repeat protein, partial [Lysobacter sp. N42]|uniref:tetratricopeptide repeat protein n=1 Tax=Lysobacter sp. N42 TaxID=2545719 RepID=UPI001047C5F6
MPDVLRPSLHALALALALAAAPVRAAQDAPPLQPLLAAEFALQAGRLDEAAKGYVDAALATRDPALAERATRIALVARDDARARRALAVWRKVAPDDAATRLSLGVAEATLALRAGNDRAAVRELSALLAAPGDDGWRQALGALAGGARTPKQAAGVLQRLLDEGRLPPVLNAWLAFGGLAQRLDRPELAERIVAEVVRRFPGDPRVALLRASQLREAGKPDEARAVLAGLAEAASGNAELRLALAREYDALRDYRAAAAVLSRGPQDDQTWALRATLLARAEDTPALTALYEALAREAERPEPTRRLLLGQIAEFLKRYEDALRWYEGVPGGPQRWVARLRSANVLHELGRKQAAIDVLRAIQQDASAEDETRRDAYLIEAALWQEDKDDARELDAYARGLAAFPDEPEILYARALAWERRDDIARAEADLRRILVIEPESVAALNALGYTLADRTTRYREALELIDRARAAEPDNAAIVDSYGWVLYRLGRNEEALVELQRAYTLQKDAEIAAHVAEVLWVLGRREEALRYFEEARRLDPDSRALARALEKTGARLPPAPAGPGGTAPPG